MRLSKLTMAVFAAVVISLDAAAESVRLITDKSVYVAGDLVWCSAFCTENGALCKSSAVAYVEMVSDNGVAATAKIALISGRGAGVISLPANIPTGNYRIFAYTASSDVAEGEMVTIFNTMSGVRVKKGVELCDDPAPEPEGGMRVEGPLKAETEYLEGRTILHLSNLSGTAVTAAISVSEDDGLRAVGGDPCTISLTPGEPETDGEIIVAKVYGKDADKLPSSPWLTAVISAPGSAADTYTGKIGADGTISFKTNNIYGDRDLICEILGLGDGEMADCHFSPVDRFAAPSLPGIPKLRLSPSIQEALTARHMALKSSVQVDTLYEFLPKRDNLLLSSADCISYHLDDYTRFDTIEDIIVELIPHLAVQKVRGHKQLKMFREDAMVKGRSFNVLAMLDGVPVTDHERLLAFDAMALSDVIVYPYMYALGNTVFSGVANFVTTRRDMSALRFNENVRIVDFHGCSYPVALKTIDGRDGNPAGRTLLWKPLVSIPAGMQMDMELPSSGAPQTIRIFSHSAE